MSPPVKVSTGNAQTDKIIENARSVPTLGEMAAHFHRMHRLFEHKAATRKEAATQALGDEADPHLLNTEDDATEDEGGERIAPSSQAIAKQCLYVATSNAIPWWSRGGGLGLFSSEPISAGDLLGFYTGDWYREEFYGRAPSCTAQAPRRVCRDGRSGAPQTW